MIILHIITDLDIGGAELMLKRLVESHAEDGYYQHIVVSLRDVGVVGNELRGQGVEVLFLGLRTFISLPLVIIKLFKIIKKYDPDIVQTWMYHADLLGGVIARISGIKKIIWGIRNTDLYSGEGVSKSAAITMKICALLSKIVPHSIVCVAYKAKEEHIKAGYSQKKMLVINNGFDVDKFKKNEFERKIIRKELSLIDDEIIVGTIARFNEYKDYKNFILAARDIASVCKSARFLMVGRGVSRANEILMGWINNTGYKDNFIMLGERYDIPRLLSSMDIFCLHSKSEGFPNVLGEAMSTGLPSVITNVGDAAELLGDAGLVVSPSDSQLLSKAILSIIEKPQDYREKIGRKARKRIVQHYSLSKIVEKYEQLYEKVIND